MKRELAMGLNAVDGLVEAAPERLVRVWLRRASKGKRQPGQRRIDELAARLEKLAIALERVDERALDQRAGGVLHQGVIAEFQASEPIDEHALESLVESAGRSAFLLVLDQVQDPHNLGACLRSALAAGVTCVVVPRDRSAGLTPVARRAAAGAAEQVPLAAVTNLARTLKRLAGQGVFLVGLAGEGEASLYQLDLTGPLALVLGGEEQGLRRLTRENCDRLARIPMPGRAESLNVSVAAGVSLFEALRQRGSA